MEPRKQVRVINGRRYSTETATVIASDVNHDGPEWPERDGVNNFLCRSPRGMYFVARQTDWEDENDSLTLLSRDAAIKLYERLPRQEILFEFAFPGVELKDG